MEPTSQSNQGDNVFDELSNPMLFQSVEYEIPTFDRAKPNLDEHCFFINDYDYPATPNGSFWDDEGKYYNRFQCDIYGGRLDKYGNYHIPKNKEFQKQQSELSCFGTKQENDEDCEMIDDLKYIAKENDKILKNYEYPEEDKSEDNEGDGQMDICEKSDDRSCCSYDDIDIEQIFYQVKDQNKDVYGNSKNIQTNVNKINTDSVNNENNITNIMTIK